MTIHLQIVKILFELKKAQHGVVTYGNGFLVHEQFKLIAVTKIEQTF